MAFGHYFQPFLNRSIIYNSTKVSTDFQPWTWMKTSSFQLKFNANYCLFWIMDYVVYDIQLYGWCSVNSFQNSIIIIFMLGNVMDSFYHYQNVTFSNCSSARIYAWISMGIWIYCEYASCTSKNNFAPRVFWFGNKNIFDNFGNSWALSENYPKIIHKLYHFDVLVFYGWHKAIFQLSALSIRRPYCNELSSGETRHKCSVFQPQRKYWLQP